MTESKQIKKVYKKITIPLYIFAEFTQINMFDISISRRCHKEEFKYPRHAELSGSSSDR